MNIKIKGIATACPPNRLTQEVLLNKLRRVVKPSNRAGALYQKLLLDDGIQTRYFGWERLEDLVKETVDEKALRFQHVAVRLSVEALEKILRRFEHQPAELDAIFIATCTGYLCPGLTSYVIERLGLSEETYAADIVGVGCAGALAALRAAQHYLAGHPDALVAVVAVEVCSAAVHWAEKPELILSNCIFSDGAAACLLSGAKGPGLRIKKNVSVILPGYRDELRFKYMDARLCNVLSRKVPAIAASAVANLRDRLCGKDGVDYYAFHSGGRKVLDAIQEKLHLSEPQIDFSRQVLKEYGNISSPTILFVLKEIFERGRIRAGDSLAAFSFGAGFSAFGLLGEWSR